MCGRVSGSQSRRTSDLRAHRYAAGHRTGQRHFPNNGRYTAAEDAYHGRRRLFRLMDEDARHRNVCFRGKCTPASTILPKCLRRFCSLLKNAGVELISGQIVSAICRARIWLKPLPDSARCRRFHRCHGHGRARSVHQYETAVPCAFCAARPSAGASVIGSGRRSEVPRSPRRQRQGVQRVLQADERISFPSRCKAVGTRRRGLVPIRRNCARSFAPESVPAVCTCRIHGKHCFAGYPATPR